MKKIGTKSLTTNNLILRQITESDIDLLYNNIFSNLNTCNICNLKHFNCKEEFNKSFSKLITSYDN